MNLITPHLILLYPLPGISASVPLPFTSEPVITTTLTTSLNTFADLIGSFLPAERTFIDLKFNEMQVISKEDRSISS
jgi:hypothetical protein